MRSTGGEGFLPVLGRGNEQNGVDYADVRNDDDTEGDQQNKQGRDKVHHLCNSPLGAREVEQGADVTVEVVDNAGTAEGELGNEEDLEHSQQKAQQPRAQGQLHTGPAGHEERVVQGVADGHVAVIGHDGQEGTLSTHQGNEKVELGHTACEGDVLIPRQQADQQFGNGD